jgi:flagellar biosynthetic protein FliR
LGPTGWEVRVTGELIAGWLEQGVWIYVSVLCRTALLLQMLPPLRGESVPMRVRAMISLMFAAGLVPLVSVDALPVPSNLLMAVVQLAKEVALGGLYGAAALLVVTALQTAGRLISHLAAMDMAESDDGNSGDSAPVLAQLVGWLAVAIFLLMGGHRQLVIGCLNSYQLYPAGGVLLEGHWLLHANDILHSGLVIGLRAAGPAALSLFLSNFLLALLGRTLPQLNILAVGFSLNALVLLVVMFLSIGSTAWLFQHELAGWLEQTFMRWEMGPLSG